jgi:hypothetical protein
MDIKGIAILIDLWAFYSIFGYYFTIEDFLL